MIKDDSFLATIIDNPDEDAPRLIYADWLEEHGETVRAEFIRLQCELAQMSGKDERQGALLRQEQVLLAEHGKAWLGKLKPLVKDFRYRRGFVEWVSLPGRAFLGKPDKMFHLAPIQGLRLTHLGMGKFPADELAAVPELSRLDALELAGLAGDERIAVIVGSPHLQTIRRLKLDEVRCGARTVGAVMGGKLPKLTALELIGDELAACTKLLCQPKIALREYSIKSTTGVLNRDHVIALAKAKNLNELTFLDLRNSSVQVPGATALAESKVLTKLQVLGLKGCAIGVRGMQALAASSNLVRLTALDVAVNRCGVNGLRGLVLADWKNLTRLNVANNDLNDECVPLFRQWPGLGRLRHLNLSDNQIQDAAMAELLAAPELAGLVYLGLGGNYLGKATVEVLVNAPHLDNLNELNLGYNSPLLTFKKKLSARFGGRLKI